MSYSYIDTISFEYARKATYISLSVVIWEDHLGLDDSSCLNQLLGCHCIGLVTRQESYVDILDG